MQELCRRLSCGIPSVHVPKRLYRSGCDFADRTRESTRPPPRRRGTSQCGWRWGHRCGRARSRRRSRSRSVRRCTRRPSRPPQRRQGSPRCRRRPRRWRRRSGRGCTGSCLPRRAPTMSSTEAAFTGTLQQSCGKMSRNSPEDLPQAFRFPAEWSRAFSDREDAQCTSERFCGCDLKEFPVAAVTFTFA